MPGKKMQSQYIFVLLDFFTSAKLQRDIYGIFLDQNIYKLKIKHAYIVKQELYQTEKQTKNKNKKQRTKQNKNKKKRF